MANVKIEGFREFRAKLDKLPKQTRQVVGAIIHDEAMRWEGLIKRSAPRNKIIGLGGRLAGSITSRKTGELSAEVSANVKYAPYVEWGTGAKVSVPADLAKYAIQFKGSRQVAGQRPQPYFFIHAPLITKSVNDKVGKYLNTEQ